MKRNIIIALTIALTTLIYSCGKDNNTSPLSDKDAFIKCKIDGSQKNFNYFSSAEAAPSSDEILLLTLGAREENDVAKSPGLAISIYSEKTPIKVGDYNSNNTTYDVWSTYFIQVYENGTPKNTITYTADGNEGSNLNVNITSLTKNHVKGKFSGKYRLGAEDKWITITEGEFSVPIK